MKKQKETPFMTAAFAIAAGFLILASVLMMNQLPGQVLRAPATQATYSAETITFRSDNLRFSIEVPKTFERVVGIDHVDFISSAGTITTSRVATIDSNLVDYLNDLDSKREFTLKNEKNETIGGYDAVSRIEYFGNLNREEKVYTIFVDGWAYTLTTVDQAVYGDLDQMAATFRYAP